MVEWYGGRINRECGVGQRTLSSTPSGIQTQKTEDKIITVCEKYFVHVFFVEDFYVS